MTTFTVKKEIGHSRLHQANGELQSLWQYAKWNCRDAKTWNEHVFVTEANSAKGGPSLGYLLTL